MFSSRLATRQLANSNIANIVGSTTTTATLVDSDADGLMDDREERYYTDLHKADTDGDGYLDGEEVISGYDPTRKDSGGIGNGNVTDIFAERLIAGIYAGDLDPKKKDSPEYTKGLDLVSLTTVTDAKERIAIVDSALDLLIVPDTLENITDYGNFIKANVLGGEMKLRLATQQDFLDKALEYIEEDKIPLAINIFKNNKEFFGSRAESWSATAVPEGFGKFHQEFLKYLKMMENHHAAASKFNDDPFLAQVAISAMPELNHNIRKIVIQELGKIILHFKLP